ncbi:MAG TPA: RNA polymerase sigma factor region1.1 domain-containing protein, partial [Rubrivivax sp.]|nr:RNA polymerase sigma factor region1.1 domain-containing protein [Rubrivivax sp.]
MTAKKPAAAPVVAPAAKHGKENKTAPKAAAKAPTAAKAKPAAKGGKTEQEPKRVKPAVAEAKPAAKAPAKSLAKTGTKPAPAPKSAAKGTSKAAPKAPISADAKPGKVDKAPATDDVDLADIDADLEGDVEIDAESEVDVEAAEDTEKAAKAKPLRMKVSRAKERALMREFGLEETTLTEEEVAKRRLELKTLIKMGKTRGFLTHQEINDHLPEKLVNEEILEAIISMLNDMGIAVYEQAPDAATLLVAGGGTSTATEEEAEEAAEAALSTVDSEFGRTTDPVRMYMREMGTV